MNKVPIIHIINKSSTHKCTKCGLELAKNLNSSHVFATENYFVPFDNYYWCSDPMVPVLMVHEQYE